MDNKEIYNLIKDFKLENKEQHKSITDKQDFTNGSVRRLQQWRSFMMGGMAVISMFLIPLIIYLVTTFNSNIKTLEQNDYAQHASQELDK